MDWDPGSEYHPSWGYWLDAFEDIRWDPEEILDFGG
jgi:hypothetical protein